MSADAAAREKAAFLALPMLWITRFTLRFPVATLALAIGLAIVSLVYTQQKLGYRTSRVDLVNPDNDYNRLWIEYANEFGDEDDAVVVVEGANRDQVVPVLQEISTLLAREDQLFHAVLHGVNLEKIRAKGLHYLSSEELLGVEHFLDEVGPIIEGNWARLESWGTWPAACASIWNTPPANPADARDSGHAARARAPVRKPAGERSTSASNITRPGLRCPSRSPRSAN